MTTVLSREHIQKLLGLKPPLIEGFKNLDEQLQPNGFDLTLREIYVLQSPGRVTISPDDSLTRFS